MVVRKAKNKLTGQTIDECEITLGYRPDGSPGVTMAGWYRDRSYACFDSPEPIEKLIRDLQTALEHLNASTQV